MRVTVDRMCKCGRCHYSADVGWTMRMFEDLGAAQNYTEMYNSNIADSGARKLPPCTDLDVWRAPIPAAHKFCSYCGESLEAPQ